MTTWDAVWGPENLGPWRAAFASGSGAQVTPYMHPDYARTWVACVRGRERFDPHFLVAEHTSGQRVLWLFVRHRGRWSLGWRRQFAPVGSRLDGFSWWTELAHHCEPIVIPAPGGRTALQPGFVAALLSDLGPRAGDWFDGCLIRPLRDIALPPLTGTKPMHAINYLRLDCYSGIESYVQSRKPGVRSGLRRRLRRIAEAGDLAFRAHDPDDITGILAWLPCLQAARSARFKSKALPPAYLETLVRNTARSGIVRCSSLHLNGQPISWMIGFWHDGIYYGGIRAFDPHFAHLAPGVVHYYHLVDWVMRQGGRILSFGPGENAYKHDWLDGDHWPTWGLNLESATPASQARKTAAAIFAGLRHRAKGRAGQPEAPPPPPADPITLSSPARQAAGG